MQARSHTWVSMSHARSRARSGQQSACRRIIFTTSLMSRAGMLIVGERQRKLTRPCSIGPWQSWRKSCVFLTSSSRASVSRTMSAKKAAPVESSASQIQDVRGRLGVTVGMRVRMGVPPIMARRIKRRVHSLSRIPGSRFRASPVTKYSSTSQMSWLSGSCGGLQIN